MSVTSSAKYLARTLLPAGLAQRLRGYRHHLRTVRFTPHGRRLETPNRRVLEDIILPSLAADPRNRRVLFVGCQWYTKIYAALFTNSEYWTIELDPAQAKFGSQGRHIVDSYLNLSRHADAGAFDLVILNGVFGWGIDTPAETEIAVYETLRALAPGGLAVIGYNDVPGNQPSFLHYPSRALEMLVPDIFEPLGVTEYVTPNDHDRHTFRFYRKPI